MRGHFFVLLLALLLCFACGKPVDQPASDVATEATDASTDVATPAGKKI